MARKAWLAYGTVQGVGFRDHVRRTARSLGAYGRVWNRADGAVFIEADGDEQTLALLHAAIETGPAAATVIRVESVEPVTAADTPMPDPFAIVRAPAD